MEEDLPECRSESQEGRRLENFASASIGGLFAASIGSAPDFDRMIPCIRLTNSACRCLFMYGHYRLLLFLMGGKILGHYWLVWHVLSFCPEWEG